jgi:hypothetical protein
MRERFVGSTNPLFVHANPLFVAPRLFERTRAATLLQ